MITIIFMDIVSVNSQFISMKNVGKIYFYLFEDVDSWIILF